MSLGRAQETTTALTQVIDLGKCPRCGEPLPLLPEYPAGSRITACRCIPICGPCGTHEGIEGFVNGGRADVTLPKAWPIDPDVISKEVALLLGDSKRRTVDLKKVKPMGSPTGFSAYGYDDTADRQGRER